MKLIPLMLLLLLGFSPAQNAPSGLTPQQLEEAKAKSEAYRQAAIHINDLAGNIHSEADAQAFVDAIAENLSELKYLFRATTAIRYRVAHAEFEAVSGPSRLIPEKRIVDVWNAYVREINAPAEALTTIAEIHNLRDADLFSHRLLWERGYQFLWTAPNVIASGPDGKVADGCRPVEALGIFYEIYQRFENLIRARDRVQKGLLASDWMGQHQEQKGELQGKSSSSLQALVDRKPILEAAIAYQRAHGQAAYQNLLQRMFEELFPQE